MDRFNPYFTDTRTKKERELTTLLTRTLTTLNIQRIKTGNGQKKVATKSNRKDYLYVCITGLPPLPPHQFQGIGIPGEKIIIYPEGFQPELSQEQTKQRLQYATLQKQAQNLHNKLKDRTDKPIVFVIHSFGTAIMCTFFRLYYNEYQDRVIGIIAIGHHPITPGPSLRNFITWTQSMTRAEMLKDVDALYQKHKQAHNSLNFPVMKNKYAHLAHIIAFGQGLGYGEFFSFNRRWYPLLKCFIYGREDNRISQSSMNEVPIYYAHKRKLPQQYEKRIRKVLKDSYGLQVDNVQQRFIYNLEGGRHSIHLQRRFQPLVSEIINEYLSVIQQITS